MLSCFLDVPACDKTTPNSFTNIMSNQQREVSTPSGKDDAAAKRRKKTKPGPPSFGRHYRRAHQCLRAVLTCVAIYALGMVMAGRTFAIPLFDALQFGPHAPRYSGGVSSSSDDTARENVVDYAVFCFGVLGSVILGWMVLLAGVVELAVHDDRLIRYRARSILVASVTVWFIFDTGFSLAIGEWQHAMFNLPFVTLLMTPLFVMMRCDNNDDDNAEEDGQKKAL
jgi:hypothetical protein